MSGRVILAGSGPGDPGLMTIAAARAVTVADVILHDHLIPQDVLLTARPDAELIDVGKIGGGRQVPQQETERLILEHARAGKCVLRLKGGDPFVFGRGGEEAQLCRDNDIPFTVIPGVTAGVAAPAYAGIPVTQRGMAAGVAFMTGHEAPDKAAAQANWAAVAGFPGTLVYYMGVKSLRNIASVMIAEGRPSDQPAAVIERATFPDQRTLHGTLSTIAELAEGAGVKSPAIVVLGDVAALGEELAWRQGGPLADVSVVVTRPKAQASDLAGMLRDQGARVIEAAVIKPEPLPFSLPSELHAFDLIVFSSPNGVRAFFSALHAHGRDARALAAAQIAAIGPGTTDALQAFGITADLVPARAVGESLAELLAGRPTEAALVVRARGGRTVISDALIAAGTPRVEVLEPYVTVHEQLDERTAARVLEADWATLTSASSVRALCAAAGGADVLRTSGLKLASIGPITTAELSSHGLTAAVEATEHTPAGLVSALLRAV